MFQKRVFSIVVILLMVHITCSATTVYSQNLTLRVRKPISRTVQVNKKTNYIEPRKKKTVTASPRSQTSKVQLNNNIVGLVSKSKKHELEKSIVPTPKSKKGGLYTDGDKIELLEILKNQLSLGCDQDGYEQLGPHYDFGGGGILDRWEAPKWRPDFTLQRNKSKSYICDINQDGVVTTKELFNCGDVPLWSNANPQNLYEFIELIEDFTKHIVWEEPDGEKINFNDWTYDMKYRLFEFYDKMANQVEDLGIKCPEPSEDNISTSSYAIYFTGEEAFDVYAAHVAHALYLEFANKVPWSIANKPDIQLQELFASYRYHSKLNTIPFPYNLKYDKNEDYKNMHHAWSLCDPRVGYDFIKGISPDHPFQTENLLGTTKEETLINLTDWASRKMQHSNKKHANMDFLVSHSLLTDRLQPVENNGKQLVVARSGCHGASKIIYDLAKDVNIPLLRGYSCAGPECKAPHSGLIFGAGGTNTKILWHADNIYAEGITPIFPIDNYEMPIVNNEIRKKLYYNAFWKTPQELFYWGFMPDNLRSQDQTKEFYIGHWKGSEHYNQYGGGNHLHEMFEFEQEYQLCSWQLLKTYLNDGYYQLRSNLNYYRKHGLGGIELRRIDAYVDRLERCIDAYGGEDSVKEIADLWFGCNRGY